MKNTRGLFTFLMMLFCGLCSYGQTITLKTLLDEMTDASSVSRWPDPAYTMKQASSYDRKSVGPNEPGWFANGDYNQFIGKEQNDNRTEYVMMDAAGPGAVVRFWLTTVVKPGVLRFYFDDEAKASIEIPAYDLMKGDFNLGKALLNPHTSYDPNGKGGNTLYLPLPYQKHCKITFEFTDSASVKTSHYYQVNYRTYAPGTVVKTFSKADLVTYRQAIDAAENKLWQPSPYTAGTTIHKERSIQAKNEFSFSLPKGNAALRLLSLRVSTANQEDIEKAFRSVILKIDFDGQQTVWCPAGDFFGSGYGAKPVKSWYRDMEDGKGTSRWLMPYRKNARITVINKAAFSVSVSVRAVVDTFKWDNNSMYFHATYRNEENMRDAKWDYDVTKVALNDSSAPIEWNFITIAGRGVYLGNTLAIDNHMDSWYGEGDAKLWVDNDTFPSEFGTGLEDYYNTSWAPVILYQTPFANAPRADNENSFGHNTFTRTRNLDGVPFNHSFRYDLEMLSWKGGTIDAAATIYWYGAPGAAVSNKK